MNKGIRFNTGKLRMDLVNPKAHIDLVKVLTMGAQKYAERNWENGLSWTQTLASLKRHLTAIENGEDYDSESGLLHISHVACNAHFLNSFYYIYPQGDDRPIRTFKIGLDIDEVIADWVGDFVKLTGTQRPTSWDFSYEIHEVFQKLKDENLFTEFYSNLTPKIKPEDIPFPVSCYITARSVDPEITKKWIEKNGFPTAPVYTVPFHHSKVEAAKESGIDIFVDDNIKNYLELNKAGITCYLMDAPHNQSINAGHRRIKSLKELNEKLFI